MMEEWDYAERYPIPYDSEEGGYSKSDGVFQTSELIDDILYLSINPDLCMAVACEIGDTFWCQKGYVGLLPKAAMRLSWERFSYIVRHKVRYFLGDYADRVADEMASYSEKFGFGDVKTPSEFNFLLEDQLTQYLKLTVLEPGTQVFRVRFHKPGEHLRSAIELGPPSTEKARKSNRMSPSGVPMFYGSFDPETEIAKKKETRECPVGTMATFRLLRQVQLLDFTTLPAIPSLYDTDRSKDRPRLAFLHSFVHDIMGPNSRDGSQHIEYVPSQIVTEYFRYGADLGIDGFIYPSPNLNGNSSCVLFCENHACIDKGTMVESYIQPWLELDSAIDV